MRDRFYSFEEKVRNRHRLYGMLAALFVAAAVLQLIHGAV